MPHQQAIAGMDNFGYPLGTINGQPWGTGDGLFLNVTSTAGAPIRVAMALMMQTAGGVDGMRVTTPFAVNQIVLMGIVSQYGSTATGPTTGFGVSPGQNFAMQVRGVCRCRVTGAVAAGDILTHSSVNGLLATNNALTAPTVNAAVAVALEPSSAADTDGSIRCKLVV
jgi:hypothetical protein